MQAIPHNKPLITAEDRAAVDSVLASGWLAQGREVGILEGNVANQYGMGLACAVSSGTAALFLVLKAMDVGLGDKIVIPTYACSALLNAIYMAGASPVLVDVLPDSFCLDPAALSSLGEHYKYAIAVNTFGAPADILSIKKNVQNVIEDCCQSMGGWDSTGFLGAKGEAAVFSFYATKIITGGQGGLIWARADKLIHAIRNFREFDCRATYEPRFNLQMTDIQAGLINSQMTRLEAIRQRRQMTAKLYLQALPAGLSSQSGLDSLGRMVQRFVVLAPDLHVRDALRKHLQRAGVGCSVPIERYELLHRYLNMDPGIYPIAERLADTTISLPIHPGLSEMEIHQVADTINSFKT